MAETKREEQDSQSSATSTTEQCPDQQPPSNQQQATSSHDPVSSAATMHTKPAGKDLPTTAGTASTRSTPPPPSHLTATHGAAPDIEITDETTDPPKSSEPSSPLSEEDFSSGGEQVRTTIVGVNPIIPGFGSDRVLGSYCGVV
jgi:hypothetical protein